MENKKGSKIDSPSSSRFDPYGYYFPKEDISFDGYSFEWLFIPGNSGKPSIRLRQEKSAVFSDMMANRFIITGKTASFEFIDSKGSKVFLNGQFLGNSGPLKDRPKTNEIVFQGKLTMNHLNTSISMTWFEGD